MHKEYGTITNIHQFGNGNVALTLRVWEYYSKEKGNVYGLHKFLCLNPKLSELITRVFKKGNAVSVEFKVTAIPYEKDGQVVYPEATLRLESIRFLPTGNNSENKSNQPVANGAESNTQTNYSRVDEDPFANKGPIEVSEDDLPF